MSLTRPRLKGIETEAAKHVGNKAGHGSYSEMPSRFPGPTRDNDRQGSLSRSCCSLADLIADQEYELPPPAALRAAQPPVHAEPRPALQPFRSRPFRTAHSHPAAAHEARRWTMFNLNKAHICANHSRCAACQANGPAIPFPYSSQQSCSSLGSTPSSQSWPLADLSSSFGYTEVDSLSALSSSFSNPSFKMDSLTDSRLDPSTDCNDETIDDADATSLNCIQHSFPGRPTNLPMSEPSTPPVCSAMQPRYGPSTYLPTAPHDSETPEQQIVVPSEHRILHEQLLEPKATKASSCPLAISFKRRKSGKGSREAHKCTTNRVVPKVTTSSVHDELQGRNDDTTEQVDKAMSKSGEEDWHDVPLSADIKEHDNSSDTLSEGKLMSETSDDAVCVKQPRSVFLGPVSMARLSFSTSDSPIGVSQSTAAQEAAQQLKDKSLLSLGLHTLAPQRSRRTSDGPPCQLPSPDSDSLCVRMSSVSSMPVEQSHAGNDGGRMDSKLQAHPLCDVNESRPRSKGASAQKFQADESVESLAWPRAAVAGALGSKDSRGVQEHDGAYSTGPHLLPQPLNYIRNTNRWDPLERQTGFAPARHSPQSSVSPMSADEMPGLVDGPVRTALAPLSSQLTRALEDTQKAHGMPLLDCMRDKITHSENPAEQSPAQVSSDGDWEVVESVNGAAENGNLGNSLGSWRDTVLRRLARLHSPQA